MIHTKCVIPALLDILRSIIDKSDDRWVFFVNSNLFLSF